MKTTLWSSHAFSEYIYWPNREREKKRRRREIDMKRERERKKETFRRQRHHQSLMTDDGVDAETSLSFFLSLSMSISLLRLFSRAHYWVNIYNLHCRLCRVAPGHLRLALPDPSIDRRSNKQSDVRKISRWRKLLSRAWLETTRTFQRRFAWSGRTPSLSDRYKA